MYTDPRITPIEEEPVSEKLAIRMQLGGSGSNGGKRRNRTNVVMEYRGFTWTRETAAIALRRQVTIGGAMPESHYRRLVTKITRQALPADDHDWQAIISLAEGTNTLGMDAVIGQLNGMTIADPIMTVDHDCRYGRTLVLSRENEYGGWVCPCGTTVAPQNG